VSEPCTEIANGKHGYWFAVDHVVGNWLGSRRNLHDNAKRGRRIASGFSPRRTRGIGWRDRHSDGRSWRGWLITGEAGVGKTRLLVEARREAERRGVLVLRGLLTYRRRSSRSPGR
jgi:hypothetical protein